jgi:SufS family cysteine desulfurase
LGSSSGQRAATRGHRDDGQRAAAERGQQGDRQQPGASHAAPVAGLPRSDAEIAALLMRLAQPAMSAPQSRATVKEAEQPAQHGQKAVSSETPPSTDAEAGSMMARGTQPHAQPMSVPGASAAVSEANRASPAGSALTQQVSPTTAGFDVDAVRADFPALHQSVHGQPLVWLDNAATTHKPQSVIDAISHFYARDNSNVHRGAHALAARATDAYEKARESVRRFIGAQDSREIVFVRGATEAINFVAYSYGQRFLREKDQIVLTTLEHHANIVPWQMMAERLGVELLVAPIDQRGDVRVDEYSRLFGPRTRLAAFCHVSNALGTVAPIQEMIAIAHRHGAHVLIDGAQSVPHFPVDVQALDADFYVFSGHKMFAPTGIGAVYGKRALLQAMPAWQGGGNMIDSVTFEHTTYQGIPARFEAGTPNLADAVGLAAAIEYIEQLDRQAAERHEMALLRQASEGLAKISGVRLIGDPRQRAGSLSFVLEGVESEQVGAYLDRRGIALRAGHHCAQPALAHFGLTSTVRPSVAFYNTASEIDALIEAVASARKELS